ncbi:hypothetical protein LTR66_000269 [Elasticomyces elasticus]|nr:hypothetical protein LTR66_000269 [Elasticomyces elasticus]KAK5008674.1 hypothetical protein LTR28_003657 [Elasticomyces elasticus]
MTVNDAQTLTLYSYYQNANGTIMETRYANSSVIGAKGTHTDTSVIAVVTDAAQRSPLGAVSYTIQGTVFRQIFYVNTIGQLKTTNTTGSNSWQTPFSILTSDSVASNSLALCTRADTASVHGLNGIRVYYASFKGYIQEVGINFGSTWRQEFSFYGSDPSAGVGCADGSSVSNIYVRNSTTAAVRRFYWTYSPDIWGWQNVTMNQTIKSGSDIAVCNDGAGTDHIFYQEEPGGNIKRALAYDAVMSDSETLEVASAGSKLDALYVATGSNPGALVMYQNATDPSTLWFSQIARTGTEVANGALL